jgi:hypothetical protein
LIQLGFSRLELLGTKYGHAMQQTVFTIKLYSINILILSFSLLFSPLMADANAADERYGTVPGEQLQFNVHWMGIPGGRAVMKTGQAEPGKYRLEAVVEAIGMVKFLHAIKDTLLSQGVLLGNGTFQSVNYHKDQRKGNRVRLTDYKFDREKKQVLRMRKGEKTKPIKISSGEANDPLAVFYSLRSQPELLPGTSMFWITVDGSNEFKMEVEIGEPTQKFTPLGQFDIIPVKVKIPSNGELFRQEEAIEIWLTADQRHMPIRVETRLSLGGVAADLVSFTDGRGGSGDIADEEY